MKCVILQPSYIPWRGHFHQMHKTDLFVFYDDVQYDKHGWRNRNRIKTPLGSRWLTIPVRARGNTVDKTPINQIRICHDSDWARRHWVTLQQSYGKAPHFDRYTALLQEFYARRDDLLSDFAIDLSRALARELGISHTRFVRSSELRGLEGTKTDRVVSVLKLVGASHYITGPTARGYLEEDKLAAAGISFEYMHYDYPEYQQLYPPYDPAVSILDLLLMKGPEAGRDIWTPEEAR